MGRNSLAARVCAKASLARAMRRVTRMGCSVKAFECGKEEKIRSILCSKRVRVVLVGDRPGVTTVISPSLFPSLLRELGRLPSHRLERKVRAALREVTRRIGGSGSGARRRRRRGVARRRGRHFGGEVGRLGEVRRRRSPRVVCGVCTGMQALLLAQSLALERRTG